MSKLNPHADTRILCPTFDEGRWVAQGNSRAEAEAYYMNAIATEVIRPPMYRVIVQHKGQPARPPEHVVRAALRT